MGKLFKYTFFVLFFCLLLHVLAVRISLLFHIFLYGVACSQTLYFLFKVCRARVSVYLCVQANTGRLPPKGLSWYLFQASGI